MKLSIATSTGQMVTAPIQAFIVAILAEMTPKQRSAVMNRVAQMAIPEVGKHILMPNGGYPTEAINS